MDRNRISKTLKEKGPLFGLGLLAGTVLVLLVVKRAEVKGTLKSAWERMASRGKRQ